MKRTLAFIFACSMLLTLSIGALALTDPDEPHPVSAIYDIGYLLDEDDRYVDFNEALADSLPYGETVYYPLFYQDSGGILVGVHESAATKSIKIKADWEEGSSYIDKLSVIKKRYINANQLAGNIEFVDNRYCYFLAITAKTRSTTTTATHDVHGTVKLRKTSGDSEYRFDYDDIDYLNVDFEVGYSAPEDSNVIPITPALFVPGQDFDEYDEETFDFEADSHSYFVVNTNSQKKIVLGMNTDYDDAIADKYPQANLDFFNGNGAAFNRIGYLYLYADRGSYVYVIENNNTLKKISASYDSYDDAFVIRTRTLGRYVVSDIKLNVADKNPSSGDEDTAVIYDNDTQTNYNPGTGGYGFDDIAYSTPAPAQTPAVANNAAATTPAVTGSAAVSTGAEKSAPPTPQQEEAQPEEDGPTIIGTTQKANDKLAAPAVTDPANDTGGAATAFDYRRLAMIICSAGAILSLIGLAICGLVAFNRSRTKYY